MELYLCFSRLSGKGRGRLFLLFFFCSLFLFFWAELLAGLGASQALLLLFYLLFLPLMYFLNTKQRPNLDDTTGSWLVGGWRMLSEHLAMEWIHGFNRMAV